MLNIAIDDSDMLYRQGLELFLQELFLKEQRKSVQFSNLTKDNVIQADVIIKSFVAGEEFLCQPLLKFRTRPGLIIGIYEGEKEPYHSELPLCIEKIIFISRSESLNIASKKISDAWNSSNANSSYFNKCLNCKYRSLTPQQYIIAKYMLRGDDIAKIATILKINAKTVSTHKRLIMTKYNLGSDCELLNFLNTMKMHNPPVHLFSDYRFLPKQQRPAKCNGD